MSSENIFDIYKKLNSSYEEYYKSEPNEPFDLQAFSLWLYNAEAERKKSIAQKKWYKDAANNPDEPHTGIAHGGVDDQISFILLSMHKLIKFYVKKLLEKTQLVSLDDVHYLMFLSETESVTKSEIINSSINEMSSGIEIINRLQKKGLIEDFEDPDDRRSRRVKITKKGLNEIKKVTSKFGRVHKLLVNAIPDDDKFNLLSLLNKNYEYHFKIYSCEKDTPLEELFEKYLGKEKK